jgi:hypothetical protein
MNICDYEIDWDVVLKIIPAIASCVTAFVAVKTYLFAKASFDKWHTEQVGKRKVELAEQDQCLFTEMPEVLSYIRSPFSFPNEGITQQTERKEKINEGHIAFERRQYHQDFFQKIKELKYPFLAYYGQEHLTIFYDARDIFHQVDVAARMIIDNDFDDDKDLKKQCLRDLWTNPTNDPLQEKIEALRDRIIAICEPVLQPQNTKKP